MVGIGVGLFWFCYGVLVVGFVERIGRYCLFDVKFEFCLGDVGCSKIVVRIGIVVLLVWGGVYYWRYCDFWEYGVMGLMWGLFSVIIVLVV